MKRSKINSEIRHMEELIQEHGFEIPPLQVDSRRME